MPNLIIIIFGLIFALIGYRRAWYAGWPCLFNLLIAVYLSIMITPQVVDKIPIIREYLADYSYAAFAFLTAIIIFVILDLFSFRFFTSASTVPFPKIVDGAGAAILGFFTGSVIAGFLLFLITITPLSNYSFVKSFCLERRTASCCNCAVLTSCNFIHDVSLQPDPEAVAKQMELITDGWNASVKKPKMINNQPASDIVQPQNNKNSQSESNEP